MRMLLAVVLVLAAAYNAAPRARAADTAYASLVGIAASPADEREEEAKLPAPEKEDGPLVAAPAPRAASAWTKLFVLLLPPSGADMPQLRASTSPVSGSRPIRYAPQSPVPRETEEGVRRGMAEMLALMSAAPDPLPAGRR